MAGSLLLVLAADVDAASWQWSALPGRERVTIDLDEARQESGASRTGTTQLDIALRSAPASFSRAGAAPTLGSLVTGLETGSAGLRLHLRDAAFGYIVSRPNPKRVVIDVFPDPLGTRWNNPGTPAPPSAPSRAVSAQPQAPEVGQTPRPALRGTPGSSPLTGNPSPQNPSTASASNVGTNTAVFPQAQTLPPAAQPQRRGRGASADNVEIPKTQTEDRKDSRPVTTMGRMAASAHPAQTDTPGSNATAQAIMPTAANPVVPQDTGLAPPTVENLNALTSQIERIPRSPQDNRYAWPGQEFVPAQAPGAQAPGQVFTGTPSSARSSAMPQSGGSTPPVQTGAPGNGVSPAQVPVVAPAQVQQGTEPSAMPGVQTYNSLGRSQQTRGKMQPVPVAPAPAVSQMQQPQDAQQQTSLPSQPQMSQQPVQQQSQSAQPIQSVAPQQVWPNASAELPSTSLSGNAGMSSDTVRTGEPFEAAPEIVAPFALRAQLNRRGPESWPEESGLSTDGYKSPVSGVEQQVQSQFQNELQSLPPSEQGTPVPDVEAQATALEPAPQSSVEPETIRPSETSDKEEATEEKPVVYVDEDGNTVPKPPDVPAILKEVHKLLNASQDQEALDLLKPLKDAVLTPEQREEVLYLISQATENVYKNNWLEGYEPVVVATNEAMNFNLRSPRVAEALLRLGMINLNTGNQDEAKGYFRALKEKYPHDPNIPKALLALGRDQFDKGQYAESVQTLREIMDDYPESSTIKDVARLMADGLFKQGHDKQALIIVDFLDRRWPRMYLDDPSYLKMVGELQRRQNRPDDALQTYWTYYNLVPDNPDNHEILRHIGDLYLKKDIRDGARDVFNELMRKYPKSASAPVALQRLGEDGLYDGNPSLEDLFALFAKPSITSPEINYARILKEYPDSQEADLATFRLAAWRFWNKDTSGAMELAQKFLDDYPHSPYVPRAEELLNRGFDREFMLAREEENYDRILSLWERYPVVQTAHTDMSDDLRVALARAQLNRGNEKQGMELLQPFLDRPAKDPDYGEYVYNLFLARALRNEDWNGVLDLGDKVAQWELPVATRAQLDYSRAISAENLGMNEKALPLWRKLHTRSDIPLYQKAYATYFMARDAERRRDIEAAYKLNLDTLKLFTQLEEEHSDKADPERIRESLAALMDVTEVANRYAEALDWAGQYARFVPEGSPDYAGLRFREARLHRKMGDLGRWKALLDEIIQREPDSVFGRMAASELRTQQVARDLTRFAPENPQ